MKQAPHSVPALLGCAAAFVLEKEYQKAIDHYDTVQGLDPKNSKARAGCVSVLTERALNVAKAGDYDQAAKDLAKALRLDSKNDRALEVWASILFAKREFDQAFIYCNRALTILKNSEVPLRVRGAIHSERGEYDKALVDLDAAIKMKPSVFSHLKRAMVYLTLNRLDEAARDCAEILKLDPDNVTAQAIQAKALIEKNELASAEKLLKSGFKKEPDNLFVLASYGELHLKKKDLKNALKQFELYVAAYKQLQTQNKIGEKEKKQCYQVLLKVAQAHIALNAFQNAFNVYGQAIALNPKWKEAYQHRGNLHRQVGDNKKAMDDFQAALALEAPPKT